MKGERAGRCIHCYQLGYKECIQLPPLAGDQELSQKKAISRLPQEGDRGLFIPKVDRVRRPGREHLHKTNDGWGTWGSVLGPILWNIAYDEVLQEGIEQGCRIVCYVDDTLILAAADNVNLAVARANIQTGLVLNRIRRLSLVVLLRRRPRLCVSLVKTG